MTSVLPLLGARIVPGGVEIGAYATAAPTCSVRVLSGPAPRTHVMAALGGGYFFAFLPGLAAGARYKLVVGERELPDPFARWLPDGVHGASSVFASRYAWKVRDWKPRAAHKRVIYEIHVGTFTEAGTYAAAAPRLAELARLGVTAIELMPVAAANGRRGWGYDGVAHFACHPDYGDPDALRAFVDAAHGVGLEVLLDVVYNHFGPSGSYLGAFSPDIFRGDATTPWGAAIDYRHPVMRRYLLESARYWLEEMRFDGLRLDATHAIFDDSPVHVLRELAVGAAAMTPARCLIAEDDRNDPRLVSEVGLDAIWADDFHHSTRVALTGEDDGYFRGYAGGAAEIARTIEAGWLFQGQVYPPSGRPRGHQAPDLEPHRFVYCLQNHDQIGNRAFGDRLTTRISAPAYAAASAILLFLPMTPLLFMGQEWGATTPFLYFTDHDERLGRAVTEGRRRELGRFAAFADPLTRETIPDPQAEVTFIRSKLAWRERDEPGHAHILGLYRSLLALRREDEVLRAPCERGALSAEAHGPVLVCERRRGTARRRLIANLCAAPAEHPTTLGRVLLSTCDDDARSGHPGEVLAPWEARILAMDGEPAPSTA